MDPDVADAEDDGGDCGYGRLVPDSQEGEGGNGQGRYRHRYGTERLSLNHARLAVRAACPECGVVGLRLNLRSGPGVSHGFLAREPEPPIVSPW